jgi:hypothetical protein
MIRRRFQLTDSKNQLLTISLSQNLLTGAGRGTWMPETPGLVEASTIESYNEWQGYVDPGTSVMYGYLYTTIEDGIILRIMRLEGLTEMIATFVSPLWNNSGTGALYSEGESVLVAGRLTWKRL